ncbi:Nucleotide-diphospho-sugar transferase domain-containing protein [Trichophyton rubrum]|nr:Nucleotide-diphospho-sugar transferase domain-containing protein [Trichophyton rubrum]
MFWKRSKTDKQQQQQQSAAPSPPRQSGLSSAPESYSRPISHSGTQTPVGIDDDAKYKAIIKYLHARLATSKWCPPPSDPNSEYHGLLLRKSRGVYISEPDLVHPLLLGAVQKINVAVAFTMATEITRIIFSILQTDQTELILPSGFQVQVVESLAEIACSPSSAIKKFQYVALVREERLLLIWHDELEKILIHAEDVEEKLLAFICGTRISVIAPSQSPSYSLPHSSIGSPAASTRNFVPLWNKEASGLANSPLGIPDEEAAKPIESLDRPLALTSSIFVGLGMCLIVVLLVGFGISNLMLQSLVDGIGTATIFVNDDGLAYLTEEQREERISFYHDNNIGWVSRPKNNQDGYIRKGRFKKASNMNFALNVSNKVEDKLLEMLAETLETTEMIDASQEEAYYKLALQEVLGSDSRIKAAGDIRIGEAILIVDADTRVPVDCLLYGAAEMFLSPEVAIIQHSTGVMQVVGDYFENGITFFTNLIYSSIRFAVGSGETAPFVGHNAFLRWKAVQSVGKPDDGYVAYWSESHVSEDFDIALRLQIAGDIVRLASYHGDEFKEGVSLTIYDELARWEKYAYGCNELVFNPIYTWIYKGPFTKLFMTFLWCNMQLSSKITILGYISSYYALASGFPLTILNYFLVGWFNGYLDKFYIESWKVLLSLIVVFSLLGNVTLAIIRSRLSEKSLWSALVENFKWMPMMAIFFGGVSFHLSLALLSHMFSIKMEWGATAKEKVDSNFFKEIPKIFKSFKWMYAVLIPLIGGMIYLGNFAPRGWEIKEVAAVVPMAVTLSLHALLPLLLNPSLMIFNY